MHLDRETLEKLRVMASEMTAVQKDIASLRIDVSDLSENMKISLHATASLSRMMGSKKYKPPREFRSFWLCYQSK